MARAIIDPNDLLATTVHSSVLPAITGAGVYAICAIAPDTLSPVIVGKRGLLYVGMTEQGLEARNHFRHENSGFSTFRRSLGALLKSQLGLTAIPRSNGISKSNVTNYRFTADGESRLTLWMVENLSIGQLALAESVALHEKDLIALMEPPLNLTGWNNPQRRIMKRLRAECAEEAARNRVTA